jgi:hypothetical protein
MSKNTWHEKNVKLTLLQIVLIYSTELLIQNIVHHVKNKKFWYRNSEFYLIHQRFIYLII